MKTIYERYIDSYSSNYITFIYGWHFSKMQEKLKERLGIFELSLP